MNFQAIIGIAVVAIVVFALYEIRAHLAQIKANLGIGGSAAPASSGVSAAPTASGAGSTLGVSPPVVTAPSAGGKLPSGIDTPDADGFVALTGLPAGNYYSKIRFAIAEVGAALQGAQHASVALNCGFLAHGRWITTQLIGVCGQIESVTDGTTGAVTYRLKSPEQDIPGTLALPPSFTVASATAHFAALSDPNKGGSGSGFSPGK